MRNLNLKDAAFSALVVYIIGIAAFIGSYFLPIMDDPDLQANIVLMIVIVPAAIAGSSLYYRKRHATNGLTLGAVMFLGAIILDAIITVPVFILPMGGDHLSFFGDPGFWLIGLVYIGTVVGYWALKSFIQSKKESVSNLQ